MRRQITITAPEMGEPTYPHWLEFISTNGFLLHKVPPQFQTAEMASVAVRRSPELHLKCILIFLRESVRGQRILKSPVFHRSLVIWMDRNLHDPGRPTPLLFCPPFKKAVYETINLKFHLEVFKRAGKIPAELTPFIGGFLATGLKRHFCIMAAALYPAAKAQYDAAQAAQRPKKRALTSNSTNRKKRA